MRSLKVISREAVPAALERAERYRLLNQPELAESICLDILAVAPENDHARIVLLLSLTDQFGTRLGEAYQHAMEVVGQLQGAYERVYYEGVVFERRARAHLQGGSPSSGEMAHSWFEKALAKFDDAEAIRPPGNDESLLRWNTCMRTMERNPSIRPAHMDMTPQLLE